jgi:hypothetical protein
MSKNSGKPRPGAASRQVRDQPLLPMVTLPFALRKLAPWFERS